jgi:ferredoxin, 2Fe-2S
MPKIEFAKKNRSALQVENGANLMGALLEGNVPVASSCHGEGVCSKCRIQILQGQENLSPANEIELFLRDRNQIPAGQRISCQTQIFGDILIDTGYW